MSPPRPRRRAPPRALALAAALAAGAVARPGAAAAPDGCRRPAPSAWRALPGADAPPVLVHAQAPARLLLDGVPLEGGAAVPPRLAPGEHALRVEAPGEAPLALTLRVDAFAPVLLHARVEPGLGLTLVRLGAACVSCPAPTRAEPLAYAAAGAPSLARAAEALRRGDWPRAARHLRAVPPHARGAPGFERLAQAVWASALEPRRARGAVARLARGEAPLGALWAALGPLEASEAGRRRAVALARWNALTERYGALVARFESHASAGVAGAGARLEALGGAFEAAARAGDAAGMERALGAGEAALLRLVAQVRGARPGDCAFQAAVLEALEAP